VAVPVGDVVAGIAVEAGVIRLDQVVLDGEAVRDLVARPVLDHRPAARPEADALAILPDPVVADRDVEAVLDGDAHEAVHVDRVVLDGVLPRVAHPHPVVRPAAVVAAKDVPAREGGFDGVVRAEAAVVVLEQVVVAGALVALVIVSGHEDPIAAAQAAIAQELVARRTVHQDDPGGVGLDADRAVLGAAVHAVAEVELVVLDGAVAGMREVDAPAAVERGVRLLDGDSGAVVEHDAVLLVLEIAAAHRAAGHPRQQDRAAVSRLQRGPQVEERVDALDLAGVAYGYILDCHPLAGVEAQAVVEPGDGQAAQGDVLAPGGAHAGAARPARPDDMDAGPVDSDAVGADGQALGQGVDAGRQAGVLGEDHATGGDDGC